MRFSSSLTGVERFAPKRNENPSVGRLPDDGLCPGPDHATGAGLEVRPALPDRLLQDSRLQFQLALVDHLFGIELPLQAVAAQLRLKVELLVLARDLVFPREVEVDDPQLARQIELHLHRAKRAAGPARDRGTFHQLFANRLRIASAILAVAVVILVARLAAGA